jgi:thiol-disulfide isomerase/thioredoxin
MSKATRIRQQNAREKIAAQRAAARRAEVRKRALITAGSVIVVVAIVVAFIVIKASGNNGSPGGSGGVNGTALPASVGKDIASVPASTLNSVGTGSVPSFMTASEGGTPALTKISDKPLTSGGKPEMLYIGAEYCPYCAAERWAMAQALSRFGTFTTPLHGIHSSSTDVDPSTPTLTFYKTSYSSKYLVFTPVENEDLSHGPLQNTTSAQQALWVKYDTTSGQQGYPFVDIGNKYVIKTPTYDPGVLAKMTWAQVAAALQDPSSPVAQGAVGTANLITAAICKTTNGQPGNVCTAPGVVKASGSLG